MLISLGLVALAMSGLLFFYSAEGSGERNRTEVRANGGARQASKPVQPASAPPTGPAPSPDPAPAPEPARAPDRTRGGHHPPALSPSRPLIEGGFENGFSGWNLDGVGDVEPTIASDLVREGSGSGRVILTGSQDRSELILDGSGGSRGPGTVEFHEGDQRYYAFSFLIQSMRYGRPGAHNLITQFKSDGTDSPNFGLQLWDYQGKRGLWSHGDAMGGDRYLAPIVHNQWNDVVIHFKASRTGQGFYEVFLNGEPVDSRDDVSMILPEHERGYIKTGIYRNGDQIPGRSELRLDSARLGVSLEQVQAR